MKKQTEIIQAIRHFCNVCNRNCTGKEHAEHVASMKGRKLKNVLLDVKKHQATIDEYATWIDPTTNVAVQLHPQ